MHACSKQLPPLSAAGLQDRGAPPPPEYPRDTFAREPRRLQAGGVYLCMSVRGGGSSGVEGVDGVQAAGVEPAAALRRRFVGVGAVAGRSTCARPMGGGPDGGRARAREGEPGRGRAGAGGDEAHTVAVEEEEGRGGARRVGTKHTL